MTGLSRLSVIIIYSSPALIYTLQYQPEGDGGVFEDEDMRQFYENLPDLKAIIPGVSQFSPFYPY